MHCEFQPTPSTLDSFIYFFPMTGASHNYLVSYDSLDSLWDCFLDLAWKKSKGGLGFTSGKYLFSMGEVNSTHAQIGRLAPNKLVYTAMQYRIASNGTWNHWSPNSFFIDQPYGASAAVGQFMDWTNAH